MTAQATEESPLLAWNGVVQSPAQGTIVTVEGPSSHGLEPSIEGRMHIIELYQEVLDERDQLLSEVHALQNALASSQELLDAARSTTMDLETRVAALEEGNRTLIEESRDMAARLTTAQIRRLEAEKVLLETQIAWHRERDALALTARPVSQSIDD